MMNNFRIASYKMTNQKFQEQKGDLFKLFNEFVHNIFSGYGKEQFFNNASHLVGRGLSPIIKL